MDSVNQFKEYMNGQHPNMNFTSELEEENAIPFLDVHITRINNILVTSVYRKPTFSGVYTNYNSYLPEIYKSGLISTLLYRCYMICSNWFHIDLEIKNIKSFMLKNGYPSSMLDNVIHRFLNKIHNKDSDDTSNKSTHKKQFQIVLPHLGTFTKRLEKKIKTSLQQHLPNFKLVFIYRASTRLSSLFKFKDRIPNYLSSGIIYKFKCGRCNSTYIGESGRHAKRRYCEHMGVSALTGKFLKSQNSTTVSEHITHCKANISLDNFQTLGRDASSEISRRIKESLFIHRDNPNINIQGNSIPLVLFTN